MTMETASLRTLSPKTSMLRVGLTSRAWKIARVATGSTAEINAPNEKLEGGGGGEVELDLTLRSQSFDLPLD